MSLILEALRKSEAERRRGLAPDVAMELPPTPASRQRSVATWLRPALVVVVLLVLAGWWARPATTAATATATEAPVDTAPPRPEANPQIAPGMPRIEPRPAVVTSAPAAETPATTAATPAPLTPPAMAATRATPVQPPPAPLPTRALPPPLPSPAGDISNDTSLLPPVKLSMLMWDDTPAKRFVILNGQRMAEGDRYGAITVIAIERSGVVVEGNGAKTRVPLP